jgi:uncharacterized protein (TIGR03435 family)
MSEIPSVPQRVGALTLAVTHEFPRRGIINAVIDQLGLKLESAKDSIAILVVDKADKPSAN